MKRLTALAALVALAVALPLSAGGCKKNRDDGYHSNHHQAWQLLGQQEVDFRTDRDVIQVSDRAGPFRQVQLSFGGISPVELYEVRIFFGDNTVYAPAVRGTYAPGSQSAVLDLPGDRRYIRRVELVYRAIPERGGPRPQAIVAVYAL